MNKFFCDVCDKEVSEMEFGTCISRTIQIMGKPTQYDLCVSCTSDIEQFIEKRKQEFCKTTQEVEN